MPWRGSSGASGHRPRAVHALCAQRFSSAHAELAKQRSGKDGALLAEGCPHLRHDVLDRVAQAVADPTLPIVKSPLKKALSTLLRL